MTKQHQKGGLFSRNMQVTEIHNHSLSYQDVRDISRDQMLPMLERFRSEAKIEFEQRAEEMREGILNTIASSQNADERLQGFTKPNVQHAMYQAQKTYGLSGDEA